MSPVAFDHLLSLLKGRLTKTSRREPIGPTERLAMTLRFLATGDAMRSIAWSYRLGKCTAHKILLDTCQVIWDILQPIYLPPPTPETWIQNAKKFEEMWHFPHAVGSIDGKHVVIQQPVGGGSDFYNYKGTNSVVLLAITDAEYRFVIVDIGVNGRMSDAAIFNRSDFLQALESGQLGLPDPCPLPGQILKAPYVFLGDEGFPLRNDLLKPYRAAELDTERYKIFNYRLSRARRVVENSFGILASTFMCFRKPLLVRKASTAEAITKAAVCLHNFLMSKEIRDLDGGQSELNEAFDAPSVALANAHGMMPMGRVGANNYSRKAKQTRNVFAQYFSSVEGSVPWQMDHINQGSEPVE